jgi:hypothetical protein
VVEDVEVLVGNGASVEEIEQRTGMEWPSIKRQLHRYGRNDLVSGAENDQRDNAPRGRKGMAA